MDGWGEERTSSADRTEGRKEGRERRKGKKQVNEGALSLSHTDARVGVG